MLNKEICKRCVNEHSFGIEYNWIKGDCESHWSDNGGIFCRYNKWRWLSRKHNLPPKDCYYLLEQTLWQEYKNEDEDS